MHGRGYKNKRRGKKRRKKGWNKNTWISNREREKQLLKEDKPFVYFRDILTYCWWTVEDTCYCCAVMKDGTIKNIIINIGIENLKWLTPDENLNSCYLLQSISNPSKTYIGYTVDLTNRIRRHNGEISGGPKKTKNARPWRIVMFISGFINNHLALRFEWLLHQATRSHSKVEGCLSAMVTEFLKPEWKRTNLKVTWLTPGYQFVGIQNIEQVWEVD